MRKGRKIQKERKELIVMLAELMGQSKVEECKFWPLEWISTSSV